jgi:hypothetical protein
MYHSKVQGGHELPLYLYIVSNDEPSIDSRTFNIKD